MTWIQNQRPQLNCLIRFELILILVIVQQRALPIWKNCVEEEGGIP
jgi:hypothetical protein